ncbi:MAG: hypothetical protein P8O16_10720 [Algoriphagus sp.]|uniref:hypothetical protein n=1 Tax=Algoriphagus sp. TaxID=1872435 RepID=UPI0026268537|nr:hypothetical protein [Algoriphagus sp.]MDG1277746.1 hypothetical protein [Algoriphagus sp.]
MRSSDKRKNTSGAVDIRERKCIDPLGFSLCHQCLDGHRTVFETEVGVAVGEHGHFERSEKSPLVYF